jgi:hypothetical protein
MQSVQSVDWLEMGMSFYEIQLLLGSATKVSTVLLMGCPDVSDEGLDVLSGCNQLKELDLTRCSEISDKALVVVASQCTKLEMLSLARCGKVSSKGVEKIASQCPMLRYLNLDWCFGVRDKAIQALAFNCPLLETLVLQHCHIGDPGLNALAACCPNLRSLDVRRGDRNVRSIPPEALQHAGVPIEAYVRKYTALSNAAVWDLVCKCTSLESLKVGGSVTLSSAMLSYALLGEHGSDARLSSLTCLDVTRCFSEWNEGLDETAGGNPWDGANAEADAVGDAVLLIQSIARSAGAERFQHLGLGHINHQPPPGDRDEKGRRVSAVAQWAEVERRVAVLTMSVVELAAACPYLQTLEMGGIESVLTYSYCKPFNMICVLSSFFACQV